MKKLICLIIFSFIFNSFQPANAAGTIKVKNCVNNKTGNARFVPFTTTKCLKSEKLFKFTIPASDQIKPLDGKDGATILSGTTDPKPEIGKLGDYYLDTKFRWMYGPKTAEGWGSGFSMLGSSGGGGTGPKGDKGDTGANGTNGTNGFIPKYGSIFDRADRLASAINTITPLLCSSATPCLNSDADEAHGVTFDKSDGSISVAATGIYNLAFSSQVLNTSNSATPIISIWLQKKSDGTWSNTKTENLAWTNTDVQIEKANANGRKVLSWNFFIPISTSDQVRLVWQTSGTSIYINSSAAAGNMPEIPGTILTVNQVG